MAEIIKPPEYLYLRVFPGIQGQYGVVVPLGNGVTVASVCADALFIPLKYLVVYVRRMNSEPIQEGRTEIEGQIAVIIDNISNFSKPVKHPGGGICSVTFLGNPAIPVMVGGRRRLKRNNP